MTDREPLTERQADVLAYIKQHIAAKHYQPSVREIGRHFGITSPNGVICHVKALERKGYIERARNEAGRAVARGFVVVEAESSPVE
jgi:repressor LexA